MTRKGILCILLLSLILIISVGCSDIKDQADTILETEKSELIEEETNAEEPAEASAEAPIDAETAEQTEPNKKISEEMMPESTAESEDSFEITEQMEERSGTFERLEDNHTVIFSFKGAEKVFYFEEPAVLKALSEAVAGSSYTLSYYFDSSLGLNIICKVTEN